MNGTTQEKKTTKKVEQVYCVECGGETEFDCICDELNFADGTCDCNCASCQECSRY